MPIDAETGTATGTSQLDGKPLAGVNIFSDAELEKSGLSLDPPDDVEEEDEDLLDLLGDDEDAEGDDAEETQEAETPEDEGDHKLIEKYKTPEALAKALRHAQRKLSEQGNELGQYRGRETALLDLVKRAGVDKEADDPQVKSEDDGVPRDEYGIPKPPDGYWKDTYLPQLKDFFTKKLMEEGYEETEARVLAAAEAAETMLTERLKWRESYEEQRATAKASQAQAEESEVQANAVKQEEAIAGEQKKIATLCAKMGVDPDAGIQKVMEIAGQMVTKALQTGQLTRVQASKPETATQAIWGAWAYAQSQNMLPDATTTTTHAHASTQTSKTSAASPPKPKVAASTATAAPYTSAHISFAKGLGISPEDLEKKYGRI